MGRDGSPKERQRRDLARKQNRRAGHERILIVCEGSKTEPHYFGEIRAAHRLHTANVVVQPSQLGTAPLQVVQHARNLFANGDKHRHIQPRAFEQVFAVFDRDEHPSYFDALHLAASLDGSLRNDARQPVRFRAIASVPSFELWLLLHYEDIRAPIDRQEVMRRLRQHLPDYAKGAPNVFAATRGQLTAAMAHAEALAARFDAHSAPEPFTAVFELVELLTTLREKPGD